MSDYGSRSHDAVLPQICTGHDARVHAYIRPKTYGNGFHH